MMTHELPTNDRAYRPNISDCVGEEKVMHIYPSHKFLVTSVSELHPLPHPIMAASYASLQNSTQFSSFMTIKSSSDTRRNNPTQISVRKRCLRCNTLYHDKENSPTACFFHGHTTGEKGLFALAPPHQGIDGEWTDRSGVIVYKWNERGDRPNTGRPNWKRRWSCCQEYEEEAPPCRRGWHVCYDDGFTLF